MGKWSVELIYVAGITVSGVEAKRSGEAILRAREFVEGGMTGLPPGVSVREKEPEYDKTAYVQKEGQAAADAAGKGRKYGIRKI